MSKRRLIAFAGAVLLAAGACAGALAFTLGSGEEPATQEAGEAARTVQHNAVALQAELARTGTIGTAEPTRTTDDLPSESAQSKVLERLTSYGLPVYCGGGKGRYVAFTFDDGPGRYTPLALRFLSRAGARATFFLVGRNLGDHPKLPHREEALGAVGDHTWTHRRLTALTNDAMKTEIARTQRGIDRLTRDPVRLFRPPYGAHSAAVDREVRSLGMLTVLWNVDSRDSLGADYRGIATNVIAGLRPGAIILMHENRGQTIRALRYHILPELARRHLRAVSVPELLALDPPSLQQLRRGWSGCGRG